MKLTKRIAAVVACAVMSMTSVAGMSASAADTAIESQEDTVITMSLEDFMATPYLNSYYEGIYYCTTDNSAYINNLGSSGITFNKVYATNGYKVRATTTSGYIGPGSPSTGGYGCIFDLAAGSYYYLSGNNWLSSTALGDASIRGFVNIHNPGSRDQYAVIDILNSNHVIMQTFVQEVNRD